MSVYSENFYVIIRFGADSTLSWSDLSPEDTEYILSMIESQGPPFRYDGALINPEHVDYVNTRRGKIPCPHCSTTSSFHTIKGCTYPEYHS